MIEGSLRIGEKVLHAGDVSVSRPGESYGPHIGGPTGALTVEIFSRQKGLAPHVHLEHGTDKAKTEGAKFQAAVEAFRAARSRTQRGGAGSEPVKYSGVSERVLRTASI